MFTSTESLTPVPELISIEEICAVFDCKEDRIIRMLRRGELPGVKLGREWKIPRRAFWERINEMAHSEALDRMAGDTPLPVLEAA